MRDVHHSIPHGRFTYGLLPRHGDTSRLRLMLELTVATSRRDETPTIIVQHPQLIVSLEGRWSASFQHCHGAPSCHTLPGAMTAPLQRLPFGSRGSALFAAVLLTALRSRTAHLARQFERFPRFGITPR